jgi:chorismate synthase
MVAAGAVAKKWLRERHGTRFVGWMTQIGDIPIDFEDEALISQNPFFAPNASQIDALEAHMDALRKAGDSCGARLSVVARGMPVGLGAPLFDKLDADIAHAMMSINAVKGVEIGTGFESAELTGEVNADEMRIEDDQPVFLSNNAGGILGGISSGQDIVVRFAVKPTSSILTPRRSIDRFGKEVDVVTKGRHDPCVGIRAVPVGEAMMAVVLADHLLRQRTLEAS